MEKEVSPQGLPFRALYPRMRLGINAREKIAFVAPGPFAVIQPKHAKHAAVCNEAPSQLSRVPPTQPLQQNRPAAMTRPGKTQKF